MGLGSLKLVDVQVTFFAQYHPSVRTDHLIYLEYIVTLYWMKMIGVVSYDFALLRLQDLILSPDLHVYFPSETCSDSTTLLYYCPQFPNP
jgi:hypothetical protein